MRPFNATTAFLLQLGQQSSPPVQKGFNATTAFLLQPAVGGGPTVRRGFNATTAFLLPGAGALLLLAWGVSMPPRRSCFEDDEGDQGPAPERFNATTAFLLPAQEAEGALVLAEFQCHHGVPASDQEVRRVVDQIRRFNATTAFLLQRRQRIPTPTRRCFNATTAFLLLSRWPGGSLSSWRVSMPPRRSCFTTYRRVSQSALLGFNATTAFLLQNSYPVSLST